MDELGNESREVNEASSESNVEYSEDYDNLDMSDISDDELESGMDQVDNVEPSDTYGSAYDDIDEDEWSDEDLEPELQNPEDANAKPNEAKGPEEDAENLNENVPEDWEKVEGEHNIEQDAKSVNPNFDETKNGVWEFNCQRCAPTYEMRRRGYDVEAQPFKYDNLFHSPEDAFENPDIQTCEGNGKADIEHKMQEWGDGSRCEIAVQWKGGKGHVFNAEQVDGKTHYIDAQTGDTDAEWYFDDVKEDGSTYFWRTDDAKPSKSILDCCKEHK